MGYVSGASRNRTTASLFHHGRPSIAACNTNPVEISIRVGPIRKPFNKSGSCSSCHGAVLSFSTRAKNPRVAEPMTHTTVCSNDGAVTPPPILPVPLRARNAMGARQMGVAFNRTLSCVVDEHAQARNKYRHELLELPIR